MSEYALDGPWLTIEELAGKTGFVKNEILFTIQTGKITPVLFTKNRPFLAYSIQHQQRIGHGCFRYTWPLAVNRALIDQLVRDDCALAGLQPVTPIQLGGITQWRKRNPYRGHLPNGVLSGWQPCTQEQWQQQGKAILMPFEHPDINCAESSLVHYVPPYYDEDDFFTEHAHRYLIRSPSSPYVYGSEYYSAYDQADFRFPAAALAKLLTAANEPQASKPVANVVNKRRVNALHEVIQQLLSEHPDDKSGVLWNSLRRDSQQTRRHFDQDELIIHMDHQVIRWVSANGIQQTLKKSSFQTLVSKLRKLGYCPKL